MATHISIIIDTVFWPLWWFIDALTLTIKLRYLPIDPLLIEYSADLLMPLLMI